MIHAPCATTSLPNRRGKAVDLDSPAFVAGGLATRAMGAIGKICPVAPVAAMADPGAKPVGLIGFYPFWFLAGCAAPYPP
jgi:hypothetical protein